MNAATLVIAAGILAAPRGPLPIQNDYWAIVITLLIALPIAALSLLSAKPKSPPPSGWSGELKKDVELPECLRDTESGPDDVEWVADQDAANSQATESQRPMIVKSGYASDQNPLDWRVSLCLGGLFLGPIVGLIFGALLGSQNLGSCVLMGLLIGGCSGMPFFVLSRQKGRFAVSAFGMKVGGGVMGLLVFLMLKLFIQTEFIDLLVLVGAGTALGFLFASQQKK